MKTQLFKVAPPMRRAIHDIAITRTGKPIIRTPGGGRYVMGFSYLFLLKGPINTKQIGLQLEVRPTAGNPVFGIMLIQYIGHTATVFGATGFLGRYIVNRLGICDQSPRLRTSANRLISYSLFRMYRCHPIQGGDGQASSQGYGRSGQGRFHGAWACATSQEKSSLMWDDRNGI